MADTHVTAAEGYRIDIDYGCLYTDKAFQISHDNGAELFRVQENGCAGIGTSSPGFRLSVAQDMTMGSDVLDGTAQMVIQGATTSGKKLLLGYDTNNNGYGFIKAGNQGVAWTVLALQPNGGNVGIGTTAPLTQLGLYRVGPGSIGVENITVENNSASRPVPALTITNSYNGSYLNQPAIWFAAGNNGAQSPIDPYTTGLAWELSAQVSGSSLFQLANIAAGTRNVFLAVNSSGNVGIGTSSPTVSLHIVHGGSIGDAMLKLDRNIPDDTSILFCYNGSYKWQISNLYHNGDHIFNIYPCGGVGGNGLSITQAGNVGIGTNAPGTLFAVNGLTSTSSYNLVRVDTSTGNFYYDSSSQRYKDNILPLIDDFSKILKADPKSFVDKTSNLTEIGYIAEEFDALGLNHLVIYDQKGQPDALKYDKIPLYLLEIIKTQESRIKALESKVGISA